MPLFSVGADGPEGMLRGWRRGRATLALPLSLGSPSSASGCSRSPSGASATTGAPSGRAGLTVAAAGGLTAAGVTAAQDFVLDHFDTGFGDAVVGSVWDAYLADLRVLGAGARRRRPRGRRRGRRPAARRRPRCSPPPRSRRGRALRATALLGLAALAVQFPELVLHTGLVAIAAGLVYVAAGDLLRVVAPPRCAARGCAPPRWRPGCWA